MRSLAPMAVAFSIGIALCWIGCGSDDGPPATVPTGTVPTGTTTGTVDCSKPSEGCECPVPGSTGECRKIRKSGDYVSCSSGIVTCGADKRWGPCVGDGIWVPYDGGVPDGARD